MTHTTTCPTCNATIYQLEGKKCTQDQCPNIITDQPEPDSSWVIEIGKDKDLEITDYYCNMCGASCCECNLITNENE